MGRCEKRETLESSVRWLLALPASEEMLKMGDLLKMLTCSKGSKCSKYSKSSAPRLLRFSQVGLLLAPSPAAAASKKEKETIKTAAQQMHGLQERRSHSPCVGCKETSELEAGSRFTNACIKCITVLPQHRWSLHRLYSYRVLIINNTPMHFF